MRKFFSLSGSDPTEAEIENALDWVEKKKPALQNKAVAAYKYRRVTYLLLIWSSFGLGFAWFDERKVNYVALLIFVSTGLSWARDHIYMHLYSQQKRIDALEAKLARSSELIVQLMDHKH